MPDLRRNPITGQWVIVAENRGERPKEISFEAVVRDDQICPFCEGNEHLTPGEVSAHRAYDSRPDTPRWCVRVIPNKFSAVTHELKSSSSTGIRPHCDIGEVPVGMFVHEVIVESSKHLTNTTANKNNLTEVLNIYRERIGELQDRHPGMTIKIFKNNGPAAGATLSHVHSQLVGLSVPTAEDVGRLKSFSTEHCPACEMIADAIASQRMVIESANFIVLCPYASRFGYEMWLMPREHASHYSRINRETLPELASLFHQSLVKLERTLKVSAYNYILHTAPFDTFSADNYHWHIEILPRNSTLAGFELGTGCYINPVPPERAAAELRLA